MSIKFSISPSLFLKRKDEKPLDFTPKENEDGQIVQSSVSVTNSKVVPVPEDEASQSETKDSNAEWQLLKLQFLQQHAQSQQQEKEEQHGEPSKGEDDTEQTPESVQEAVSIPTNAGQALQSPSIEINSDNVIGEHHDQKVMHLLQQLEQELHSHMEELVASEIIAPVDALEEDDGEVEIIDVKEAATGKTNENAQEVVIKEDPVEDVAAQEVVAMDDSDVAVVVEIEEEMENVDVIEEDVEDAVAVDQFVGAGSVFWFGQDESVYVADAYGGKLYRYYFVFKFL